MKIILFFFVTLLTVSIGAQENQSDWAFLRWKLYKLDRGPQTAVELSDLRPDALCYQHLKDWPREGKKGDVFFLARATLYSLTQDLSRVPDLSLLVDQWASLIKIPDGNKNPPPGELQEKYSYRLTYQFALRHQAVSGMGALCLVLPRDKGNLLKICKDTLKGVLQKDWLPANRLLALFYFLSLETNRIARGEVLDHFAKNDGKSYFVTGKNKWTQLVKGVFIEAQDDRGTPRFDYTLADDKEDIAIGSIRELEVFYQKDLKRRSEMLKELARPETELARRWFSIEIDRLNREANFADEICQNSVKEACAVFQVVTKHQNEVKIAHRPLGLVQSLSDDTQKIKSRNPLDNYPSEKRIRTQVRRNRQFAKKIDPGNIDLKRLLLEANQKHLLPQQVPLIE